MENMGYCKWENTLAAFKECLEGFYENEELSGREAEAMEKLLSLAREFVEDSGGLDND
jgi:hypothetical protein